VTKILHLAVQAIILLLTLLLQLAAELGLDRAMVAQEEVAEVVHQEVALTELAALVQQIKVMTEGGPLAPILEVVAVAELGRPDQALPQPLVAMVAMELHLQFLDHL
jgi:hypothetical protein